jgi:hypothetical protein
MNEGKNILKIDGPISNKTFIKNMFIIFGYATFGLILTVLMHIAIELTRYTIVFFIAIWGLLALLILYTSWINFFKRIWDIIGDKGNAIFYTVALFIANISIGFIPIVKYFGIVFSIALLCFLAIKKGKLVNTETKNNNDVA